MRRARDDLEADLQETRYFVKELKDFLSDPLSDPTDISTVSEWILNAKLPLSLAALKRKLQEIRALAAGLPDSTAVLDQAGPQLDIARRLLQEAQDARDAGLGVKDDVDGLLEGFTTVEGSLSGLNDKVQDSLDIVEDISNSLAQTKAQLTPAVKALGEASALAEGMKPQLDGLKALVRSGGLLAQNAKGEANMANEEADAATRDLASLEKQLEQLRAAERTSGHGDGTGTTGERLQKLQEEAGSLAQDTGDMMKALAGKADSLRRLQDEVLLKSQRLTGLDGKLRDLLADMRQKVKILSTCQG
uniref:Si:ch1073-15f12.3 n=1 Tax=Hucho hucho TaxID=62062 RepID=A0A4W5QM46_9TELE